MDTSSRPVRLFLRKLLLLGTLVGLACAALALMALHLDRTEGDMYLYALRDKHALLERTPAPRILLVGGSNVPMGIDSTRLEEALGRPVVNMGLHAGIGLRLMLSDLLPSIRRGDCVVIVPEYDHFFGHALYGEETLVSTVVDVRPADVFQLRGGQWTTMSRFLNTYLRRKLSLAMLGIFNPRNARKQMQKKSYVRTGFDGHGDETRHLDLPRPEAFIAKTRLRASDYNPTCLDDMNAFAAAVRARGGTTLFSFPSIWRGTYERNADAITLVARRIEAGLTFPVTGTPRRYCFEKDECFDTEYHLNRKGRARRTALMVEDLRPRLSP